MCALRSYRCSDLISVFYNLHVLIRANIFLLKGTCIFTRKFPPPLYNKGQTGPFRPQLEEEHYVYNLEENTHSRPLGNMEVILATDVEGITAVVILC